jgi:hypothetical protein
LCPSEAELLLYKILGSVSLGLVCFIGWLAFVARPALPELDWLLSRALQGILSCLSKTSLVRDTRGDGLEMSYEGFACFFMVWAVLKATWRTLCAADRGAKDIHLAQYLKVFSRG